MGSINRVMILGVIGQQPELKTSRGGKPYVNLSLATHKRFKDADGNTKRETQWHKVMIWGKNAELCSTYCEKGSALYVEGHLATYVREDSGRSQVQINIVADQIQFIPGSKMALSSERGEFESLSSLTPLDLPPVVSHDESSLALN